jgi:hypothetical protein
MANDQSSFLGLRPLRRLDTTDIMYFEANTAQNFFRFVPVVINNSGQAAIASAAVNTQYAGVCVGFLDENGAALPASMDSLNEAPFMTTSSPGRVAVCTNPDMLYSVEADTGGSATAGSESIGAAASFTYLQTTGNTTTGIANAVLDTSTIAVDTAGSLLIVGLLGNINQDGTVNTGSANFTKFVVKIRNHQLGQSHLSLAV